MTCPKPMSPRSSGASLVRRAEVRSKSVPKREHVALPPELIVFERGWLSANNILFLGDDENIVIDTGYWTHANQTLKLIEHALGKKSLSAIVNTHLHSDHCGGNAALKLRYPDTKILIPPGLANAVTHWDANALTYTPTGQHCPPFAFDETLEPGRAIKLGRNDWQILAAPGHDPDSVIFFDPKLRILISADALWENGFGVVFPELEGNEAFAKVAATLDLIERLDPAIVIPGHGAVFSYTPSVLAASRRRLNSFLKDPVRHARHAAKVLLKFKLLEIQHQPINLFLEWAESTAYFAMIQDRFFKSQELNSWTLELCEELVRSNAAHFEGNQIINV